MDIDGSAVIDAESEELELLDDVRSDDADRLKVNSVLKLAVAVVQL